MILHKLINCSVDSRCVSIGSCTVISGTQSCHQCLPIRFNNFCSAKVQKLLHKNEHPGSKCPCFPSKQLNFWIRTLLIPCKRFTLIDPAGHESCFENS